jgi:hypothetical protein
MAFLPHTDIETVKQKAHTGDLAVVLSCCGLPSTTNSTAVR